MSRTIKEANPKLRGWVNYFCLAGNTTIFQELDSWLRRKLRAILWRQWKRNLTRARNLIKLGFSRDAAWRFVRIQRGPWATAGTFNMHRLLKNSYFDSLGLVSLQSQYLRLQRVS
jgi:RNA-directed DNA polymerase